MKTKPRNYAAPVVYSVEWTARAFVSYDDFSLVPDSYFRFFSSGIGWDEEPDGVRLRFTSSAREIFRNDAEINREIYRSQAETARESLARFLDGVPGLKGYQASIEVDARPFFRFTGTAPENFNP